MALLTQSTRHAIKESFGNFAFAVIGITFAIALTYVEDFLKKTARPGWICGGVEFLSIILFIGDGLVIVGCVVRVLCKEAKNVKREINPEK